MITNFSIVQSFFIAVIQGVTELFPVSSLGHAIVLPALFHFNFNLEAESVLPYLTALHLGTVLALLIYFWKDWMNLLKSLFDKSKKDDRKLLFLLITATIPAGILGLLLEKKLSLLFANVTFVCYFLIANGVLLFLGEKLRKKQTVKNLSDLTYKDAFFVGTAQALALLPGISRSGVSLIGGLIAGLKHEAAAKFSFLLATPIILAAAVLEVPKLMKSEFHGMVMPSLVGGVAAGIVAYLATWFLMKYFKKHEVNSLFPFGIYCMVLGVLTLVVA